MDKRRFILTGFVLARPTREKFADCLAWLEDAWQFLGTAGYVPKDAAPKPRKSVDYVAALDESQRSVFLDFWTRYNAVPKAHRSGGRNEAAMRWGEIDPDPVRAAQIMAAATADAERWRTGPPAGVTRIYAQGWLTARRWEDHEPAPSSPAATGPTISAAEREALATLRHWQGLAASRPNDPNLAQQVADAETRLERIREGRK
jgi:hypothetical protein